jgi:hypothetical protein
VEPSSEEEPEELEELELELGLLQRFLLFLLFGLLLFLPLALEEEVLFLLVGVRLDRERDLRWSRGTVLSSSLCKCTETFVPLSAILVPPFTTICWSQVSLLPGCRLDMINLNQYLMETHRKDHNVEKQIW